MPSTAAFNETARHYMFLAAAWIANVDGNEGDAEIDALCQLREALGISPSAARKLHHLARDTATLFPPSLEVA